MDLLAIGIVIIKHKDCWRYFTEVCYYHMKVAICGDYSSYTSKSLMDFIYESNKGNNIFFLDNEKEAIEKFVMINTKI